jgi:chromosome segregation ATPase
MGVILMSQTIRIREMESYIKRLGEVINLVYKKLAETENRVDKVEMENSKLKAEVEDTRSRIETLKSGLVTRSEFDELLSSLTSSLKEVVPVPSSGVVTSEQQVESREATTPEQQKPPSEFY